MSFFSSLLHRYLLPGEVSFPNFYQSILVFIKWLLVCVIFSKFCYFLLVGHCIWGFLFIIWAFFISLLIFASAPSRGHQGPSTSSLNVVVLLCYYLLSLSTLYINNPLFSYSILTHFIVLQSPTCLLSTPLVFFSILMSDIPPSPNYVNKCPQVR